MRSNNIQEKIKKKRMIFLVGVLLLLVFYKMSSPSDVPADYSNKKDQGREVVIEMPNGHKMTTYEKYLVQIDDQLYFKNEYQEFKIKGEVIYK